jgi:hypothetical protein
MVTGIINRDPTSKSTRDMVVALRSGSIVDIGRAINDAQREIDDGIAGQSSRTYTFLNATRAMENTVAIEQDEGEFKLFQNITRVKAIARPFHVKKWGSSKEISKNYGITAYTKTPGGTTRKAFEYLVSGTNFDAIVKNVDRSGEIIDIPMDHDCIARSNYKYINVACFPRLESTSWSSRNMSFGSKDATLKFLKRAGFERAGFDPVKNEMTEKGTRIPAGDRCKQETGEQCYPRWKHPGTGIRMIAEKWSLSRLSSVELENVNFVVPAGKLPEWKQLVGKMINEMTKIGYYFHQPPVPGATEEMAGVDWAW